SLEGALVHLPRAHPRGSLLLTVVWVFIFSKRASSAFETTPQVTPALLKGSNQRLAMPRCRNDTLGYPRKRNGVSVLRAPSTPAWARMSIGPRQEPPSSAA